MAALMSGSNPYQHLSALSARRPMSQQGQSRGQMGSQMGSMRSEAGPQVRMPAQPLDGGQMMNGVPAPPNGMPMGPPMPPAPPAGPMPPRGIGGPPLPPMGGSMPPATGGAVNGLLPENRNLRGPRADMASWLEWGGRY